jgi:hypothetical protein
MFGHQDEHNDHNDDVTVGGVAAPVIGEPTLKPIGDNSGPGLGALTTDPPLDTTPTNALSPAGGYPEDPSVRVKKGGEADKHPEEEKIEEHSDPTPPVPPIQPPADDLLDHNGSDLNSIKIQALDELYPLIDKLDLTPDERFRTLMMMIQASDNQELIKPAFEAAHNITDEKTKAQALLDIVNEINYFTQNPAA